MYLRSQDELSTGTLTKADNIQGNVIVHETAIVDPSASIGPNVVIGAGCKVGPGCKVSNSTLMSGTEIKGYSYVDGSIIGSKSTVG